jgi:hypothetical protein
MMEVLHGTGRGTMRSMVEGHPRARATSRGYVTPLVPRHPRFAAVPLPVSGRN